MKFENGRLILADGADVRYVPANNFGGRMTPELIVVHDTAGRLDKFNSVGWFGSKKCRTSAHFVIERDGTITQMVDVDRKAWHAGKSQFEGRKYCNSFAVGIEIVNPGKLKRARKGRVKAWYHTRRDEGFALTDTEKRSTPEHGTGYWMGYTPAQIEAVRGLVRAIAEAYPTIDDLASHWQISPGRKIDTNPLFPLDGTCRVVKAARSLSSSSDIMKIGARGAGVEQVQERLRALGYAVGTADGMFGPQTRAAVLAFEAENSLKIDGSLNCDDQNILLSPGAKAMPRGAREEATVGDLAAAGSSTIKHTRAVKGVVKAVGAGAAADAAGQAVFQVSWLDQASSMLDTVLTPLTSIAEKAPQLLQPKYVGMAIGAFVCVMAWRWASKIEWSRLRDHRTGQNLGR